MITFIAAVYNEKEEINNFLNSVAPYVDAMRIVDDGSIDGTKDILDIWYIHSDLDFEYGVIEHTGLPETVKDRALKLVPKDTEWVLMLDADERISPVILKSIREWTQDLESANVDYVYFRQIEIIDDKPVREFQKAKLFRPNAIHFPLNNIHADDQFEGSGVYHGGWIVEHRKSSTKQIIRETEYLETYRKLLDEGKIDEGRYKWLVGLHHYVVPHG